MLCRSCEDFSSGSSSDFFVVDSGSVVDLNSPVVVCFETDLGSVDDMSSEVDSPVAKKLVVQSDQLSDMLYGVVIQKVVCIADVIFVALMFGSRVVPGRGDVASVDEAFDVCEVVLNKRVVDLSISLVLVVAVLFCEAV